MRHLYGALLGIAATLTVFFGGSWGYIKLLKLPVAVGGGSLLSNHTALLALAALLGAAVLVGLLTVVPTVSPLASGLPGLLFIAWTALYLASVRQAVKLIPFRSQAFGTGWEELLFTGVVGAFGAVMILPLFVPSRWRRPRRKEAETLSGGVSGLVAEAATDSAVRRDPEPRRGEEPIVGTVLPRRVRPGPTDTTGITGASRTLRNTGSFGAATGSRPPVTGSFPSADDDDYPGRFRNLAAAQLSSVRSWAAAAAIAAIFPLAASRGRYFIPQSGASTIRDAGT